MSNYLGNVLSVVSDKPLPIDWDVDGTVDCYKAEIVSASDYYPFGAPMASRSFSSASYRYGFNGQEKDDEVTGNEGTSYTAMFWEYDARLGRRWNIDPVLKQWESPYATFHNNPIGITDHNGDDGEAPPTTSTPEMQGATIDLGQADHWSLNQSTMPPDQTLDQGSGDVQHQIYVVRVVANRDEFDKFQAAFRKDPSQMTNNSWATYTLVDLDNSGDLTGNDRIDIAIDLDDGSVRVDQALYATNGYFSTTFYTLQGHPEAGFISFTGRFITEPTGETYIEFTIDNTTRQALGVAGWVPGTSIIGRFAQMDQWMEVMANVGSFVNKDVYSATIEIETYEWNDAKNAVGKKKRHQKGDFTDEVNEKRH